MIRRPPRSTQSRSSAASDVYKRQVAELLGHELEAVPVVFGQAVLDADDGVLGDESRVVVHHLGARQAATLALEDVLAAFEEARGSGIESDEHIVAGLV